MAPIRGSMLAFLRLTRPFNLLIIAATMFLMRYGVIEGNLERGLQELLTYLDAEGDRDGVLLPDGFRAQMPLIHFILLMLSTVLVAAGGNVINDYFDTRMDRINKPGEVIVGRQVKRRVAITAHWILSGLGFLLGAYVAWRSGMLQWAMFPAFAIAALWSYSTILKRQLILGNVLVAILTGLVPLTVGIYEIPLLQQAFAATQVITLPNGEMYEVVPEFRELWYWIMGYSAFAFVSTLVRELQKDMADVKGDMAGGCRTIPIVWGMTWSRVITLFYIGLLLAGIVVVQMTLSGGRITYWYLSLCVIGPLLISAGFTYQARQRSEHVMAGQMMKLAMVMAISFSLLIPYLS